MNMLPILLFAIYYCVISTSIKDEPKNHNRTKDYILRAITNPYAKEHKNFIKNEYSNKLVSRDSSKSKNWNFNIIQKDKKNIHIDSSWMNEKFENSGRTRHNITKAWQANVHGDNINICLIDFGIDNTHNALQSNYDSSLSTNFAETNSNPYARTYRHGTECAGLIISTGKYSCSRGIANNSKLGSVKLKKGNFIDSILSQALTFKLSKVDIYFMPLGTVDDGVSISKPGPLSKAALENGTLHGRNGKGSIYILTAGNGGPRDDCACDGYLNNINIFVVGSTTNLGHVPHMGESCSAIITSAYSNLDSSNKIATSSNGNNCVNDFDGSSMAGSIVTGIIALILNARPDLTWRDVMYIIVLASNPKAATINNNHLTSNAAGYIWHRSFGFGLLNAGQAVDYAKRWTLVPPMLSSEIKKSHSEMTTKTNFKSVVFLFENLGNLKYIEQVEFFFSLGTEKRGDAIITLTSPSGTVVDLLKERPRDNYYLFPHWNIKSLGFWGENPEGYWELSIAGYMYLLLGEATLKIHGTSLKRDSSTLISENITRVQINAADTDTVEEMSFLVWLYHVFWHLSRILNKLDSIFIHN